MNDEEIKQMILMLNIRLRDLNNEVASIIEYMTKEIKAKEKEIEELKVKLNEPKAT